MKRPLIGIVPLVDAQRESYWMLPGYMRGVEQAGGLPIMLPLTDDDAALRQLADTCDGFLLTGGQDVSPALYGAAPVPACGETCPARDAMETKLLALALEQDQPVLGICRGIQFLNVYLGGTLYQDLPSEYADRSVSHSQSLPSSKATHAVAVAEESLVRRITGSDTLWTNSFHHQAVRDVAPGFRATACTRDGVVEAIEPLDLRIRVLGVQFHPEAHTAAGDTTMRKFFVHLVREAAREMSGSPAGRKR